VRYGYRPAQAQERDRDGGGPGRRGKKGLIEAAYGQGALSVWTEDEAGPYQTLPYPGYHWHQGGAIRYPHEYVREGTAKQLTLFHPASGEVRVKGVRQATNAILHPWLEEELEAILAKLPESPESLSPKENRERWERWQAGLVVKITLPEELPPLRLLLVLDNLSGHQTPAFVLWLFAKGVMPLYTPLGGSWLNMAESIQRILKRRALDGCHPKTPEEIIAWLEAAARGWNHEPTPFVWAGRRRARRERARERRHRLGGSGACTKRPLARRLAY
jgi:transposase